MKNKNFCYLISFTLLSILFFNNAIAKPAVTYNFTGGRFGDNIAMYTSAKWVSYKYDMTMLYKPFTYSDQLVLHNKEKFFDTEIKRYPTPILLNKKAQIDYTKSIVYTISPHDKEEEHVFTKIDWNDQGFIAELKKMIAPQKPVPLMKFPEGCITVALHIRKGGYEGNFNDLQGIFPDKFIDEQFYINQTVWLYEKCRQTPLYIFIFTDDEDPAKIQARFEKQLAGLNVIINCRKTSNRHDQNVLDDYFSFLQFDCFIHGLSNFATTASRIGNFYINIEPIIDEDRKKFKPDEKKIIEKLNRIPTAFINHLNKTKNTQ